MSRRRLLLALRQESEGELTFPVNLAEGDNGAIGVALFNFLLGVVAENGYLYSPFEFGDIMIAGSDVYQILNDTPYSGTMYLYSDAGMMPLHPDGYVGW